jgi:hypothetical protein
MKNFRVAEFEASTTDAAAKSRILLNVFALILFLALIVSLTQTAHAGHVTVPPLPSDLVVEAGNKPYRSAYAEGTQAYICLPSGWTFYGPQATLFDKNGKQAITHFLSPNPDEFGTLRATWQHSKDTSAVWAMATKIYSEADYVAPGAIPWLLLKVVGAEDGTFGVGKVSYTTFIQRVNTTGGVMPTTGCSVPTDVGKKQFVPYTADYIFYRDDNPAK